MNHINLSMKRSKNYTKIGFKLDDFHTHQHVNLSCMKRGSQQAKENKNVEKVRKEAKRNDKSRYN